VIKTLFFGKDSFCVVKRLFCVCGKVREITSTHYVSEFSNLRKGAIFFFAYIYDSIHPYANKCACFISAGVHFSRE